jgi:polyisoprenoid-binding protein YceI
MKYYIFLLLSLFTSSGTSLMAQKYASVNGNIMFYSKTSLEDIKAENKQVQVMLNTESGAMAFKVVMKNFKFAKAAMQDHFNNKQYLDTDQFPNAVFEGKLINAEKIDFSKEGKYSAEVEGNLTIKGVTNTVKEKGTIEVKDGKIQMNSVFNVLLSDYKVSIPGNYVNNISNSLQITVSALLSPFIRP